MMQAVILADRKGQELAPLCNNSCPALLPVANRPVLQYTIEDLAAAGIKDILLVVSSHAERIESRFGNGELWGVRIRYQLSRGEESADHLLARFASLLKPPFLAVRGDLLRGPCIKDFLTKALDVRAAVVGACIGGRAAGLSLVNHWPVPLPDMNWPVETQVAYDQAWIEPATGLLARLDSLADFHLASLSMLHNTPAGIELPGREIHPGLRVERACQVDPRSHLTGQVLIGEHSSVHPGATLTGPTVISHDCYLESGVQISNSVVMPGTYVGENLQVENAIIAGDNLIRVDTGVRTCVPDPMLLSDMDNEVSEMVIQWPEATTATALLILSLPLWPLALLLSVVPGRGRPLQRRTIVGNRSVHDIDGRRRLTVEAWQFTTAVPLLRHLPMLWLVIRGHLRLFGSAPLTPQRMHCPADDWDSRRDTPAAGILGPAQLLLPADAPDEEVRLTEVEFIHRRGCGRLLGRLLLAARLLLSARAWLPAQRAA